MTAINDPNDSIRSVELSIVMPCLNEAETLERCIQKAWAGLQDCHIDGEIIIADNGSTDGSQEIAIRNGAQVIAVKRKGYGAALLGGIAQACGKYVIMADSDDSYDLHDLEPFIAKLRQDYQLVMGTRIKGNILKNAMPPLHRWIGNPILTTLGNIFFGTRLSDYHCGMRGFDRVSLLNLKPRTPGMEFATEMVAKAALNGLRIAEVPITYYPDGRVRAPHLRTWRDGWRHLRFMLLLSPAWTFLYPGIFITLLGIVGMTILLPGPLDLGGHGLDVHTLLVAGVSVIVGVQLLTFWLGARLFAANIGLLPLPNLLSRLLRGSPLAMGLGAGSLLIIGGLLPSLHALQLWTSVQFGALNYQITLRWLIPGLVLITVGIHIFFASFIVSLVNFTEDWSATGEPTTES